MRARLWPGGLRLQLEDIAERQPEAADQTHEEEFAAIVPPDMFVAVAKIGIGFAHNFSPARFGGVSPALLGP
jgi:hypothetical protein